MQNFFKFISDVKTLICILRRHLVLTAVLSVYSQKKALTK